MPEGTPLASPRPDLPLGLIAGNGQFPRLFAEAARAQGRSVVAVGLRGETLPTLAEEVALLRWAHVGQVGRMVRLLRRAGCRQAALAGGVDKRRLFARGRLDWQGAKLLWRLATKQDDGLLRAFAATCERAGLTIVPSTQYLTKALMPLGPLGRLGLAHLPARTRRDVRFGLAMAQRLGALDVGQTVVICRGAVVALEGMEGTDACILRGGKLAAGKGAVVVKVAKPQQDMRFDVPAIGPTTLDTLAEANISVLALEAHRTLLLDVAAVRARADALGIAVVGVQEERTCRP